MSQAEIPDPRMSAAEPPDTHSGSPERAPATIARPPFTLRAAIATWSRHDRRASGEVVIATAQDLIDAGSSPRREALGLLRSGVGLRVSGFGRNLRAAPWRAASRLAVIASGLLIAALVVSHQGDLLTLVTFTTPDRTPYSSDAPWAGWFKAVPALVAALALISSVSALARQRLLAVVSIVLSGLIVGVAHWRGGGLGEARIDYGQQTQGAEVINYAIGDTLLTSDIQRPVSTGIMLDGVVGAVLFMSFLAASGWLLIAWLEGRRVAPETSVPAATQVGAARRDGPRGIRRQRIAHWAPPAGAAIAALIAAPALGHQLDALAARELSDASVLPGFTTPNAGTVWLLYVAIGLSAIAAVGLRRRAPAAALAAVMLGAALWFPMVWMSTGLGFSTGPIPFASLFGEGDAWLAFYAYTGAVGVVLGAVLVASTGRHHRSSARLSDNDGIGSPAPPATAA